MHLETLNKETSEVFDKLKDSVSEFYLAGGTALALTFGHRISIDLDFFCIDAFSTEEIVNRIKEKGNLSINSQEIDTLNGVLDGVKISFFRYPYKLLFPLKNFGGILLADERDIAAMKILAISSRGTKKDFVDLFVLLKKYSLNEILEFFGEKYKERNYNIVHILKSLVYFFDADENPEPIYIEPIVWENVKINIKKIVEEYMKLKTS